MMRNSMATGGESEVKPANDMSSLVQEHANAAFEQVKALSQRAKGYVHFTTFEDDEQVYGEHFGQSIVKAA